MEYIERIELVQFFNNFKKRYLSISWKTQQVATISLFVTLINCQVYHGKTIT